MADVKISGLPASTTPLAGTEVLPIVQGGATKQVSVANLTAGRAVSAASLNTTGDITPSGYLRFNNYGSNVNDFSVYITAAGGTTVASQSAISLRTANAERARVFASGGVSIGNSTDPGATNLSVSGNVVMATSGKGIDFSATPGTGTSELLADYEEGTFTATLAGFVTNPTVPVTSTSRYTKVGREVTCQIAFRNVDTTGASGPILVQGLPFTAATDAIGAAQQSAMSSTNIPVALLNSGATQIELLASNVFFNLSFTPGVGQYLFVNITYTV